MTDWDAWLGPAADEMSAEQRERFEYEADLILTQLGDDPDVADKRDVALSILVQYLLGETTLTDVGRRRVATQQAAQMALIAAQQVARLSVLDGVPEAEAARQAGIDRMTVRKALGKR